MRAKLVTGLVRTRLDAERAVERVMSCGYKRDAISLVMSDDARGERVESGTGSRAAAGGGVGAAVGAAFAAFAAAGASAMFPGLGLVVAGPLESALAGADSAAGGLVGAGVPEHRAHVYESGLRQGAVLVGVHATSERDAEILEMILEYSGAEDVRSESAQRRPYDSFI
ncbi:hypothetical protein SOCE836_066560 [Sorangium cellulosum]|uniref:Uncharacterized protein n=2 Tax=Polyangiaceae TaxID=49 RepID=A0A4V0NGV4_SORCE|nr:hypothetical protein SOCE836_066560 [Sorangium cellulosum]WCQ93797.1 hypothetical protein NQZ70_06553 [Sorangium sp. Soce836]